MSGQAKRGKVIMDIVKGKQMATRLQTLLRQPDDGLDLAQQLALQILASFTDTLSEMGSCAAGSAQISFVDCGASAENGRKKGPPPPGFKERRGLLQEEVRVAWLESFIENQIEVLYCSFGL